MPKTSKLLDSEVVSTAKKELQKLGSYGYVSRKLLAVIAASEHGISEVAKIYGVSRNSITEWIKHIKNLNLTKLEAPKERCKPQKLNEEQMLEVKSWIGLDSSITSKALMIKIKEFYDIDVSITTAYRIIKRLNYSYITPRPTHYKQDKEKVEEFKKNLKEEIQKSDKRIFFFDEARFGTHSKIGHGWFIKGSRTEVKVKLGFKNFYLYSAVEVGSGNNFTLHLPYVNTECMQIFLDEFAREMNGQDVVIIMDGAGWHKSKTLVIPSNIDIIYLPPFSPELNPVERLWLHIKKAIIYNKIYDTLDDLENVVAEFIANLNSDTITKVCNFGYMPS